MCILTKNPTLSASNAAAGVCFIARIASIIMVGATISIDSASSHISAIRPPTTDQINNPIVTKASKYSAGKIFKPAAKVRMALYCAPAYGMGLIHLQMHNSHLTPFMFKIQNYVWCLKASSFSAHENCPPAHSMEPTKDNAEARPPTAGPKRLIITSDMVSY